LNEVTQQVLHFTPAWITLSPLAPCITALQGQPVPARMYT